jgi:NAD(P)-dependent dehydrogenase (short-subunit alcohol dehydrogenase family)
VDTFGGLDAAVANAGVAPIGSVEATDPREFEGVIAVNLLGVYRTLRLALPHVRERRGYLLAIASLAAPVHTPLMAHYSASKAGAEALANAFRTEVAHDGVAVGVAYFGWIDTGMVREAMEDPAAAAMRRSSRWPVTKDYPAAGAGAAVADGIERRARVVAYPRWVRPVLAARGLLQPVVDAQLRRAGVADAVRDSNARAAARLRPGEAGANVGPAMRVIDCDCGATLQAANDDDLARRVRDHLASDHPDMEMSDEEIQGFVAEKAYAASDS